MYKDVDQCRSEMMRDDESRLWQHKDHWSIGARTTVLMVEFHLLRSSPDPLGCLRIPTSLDQLYTKTTKAGQDNDSWYLMVSHGTRSLVPFCTYRIQTLQDLAYLSMRWCICVCHNIDVLDSEKAQRGGFVCSSLQTIHHSSIFVHDGVLVS